MDDISDVSKTRTSEQVHISSSQNLSSLMPMQRETKKISAVNLAPLNMHVLPRITSCYALKNVC